MFTRFDTARFVTSVVDLSGLSAMRSNFSPEIAFVGRSNAGKSSTINAIANRSRLAYASKLPGRTQCLNFFELTSGGRDAVVAGHLVDLPGYGFAKVDAATRRRWDELVGGYLVGRSQLRGVVLVVDSRRGLLPADEDLIALLRQRDPEQAASLHLLLSKVDQINTTQRRATLAAVEQRAATLPLQVTAQLFSARTREGVETLREAVGRVLAE